MVAGRPRQAFPTRRQSFRYPIPQTGLAERPIFSVSLCSGPKTSGQGGATSPCGGHAFLPKVSKRVSVGGSSSTYRHFPRTWKCKPHVSILSQGFSVYSGSKKSRTLLPFGSIPSTRSNWGNPKKSHQTPGTLTQSSRWSPVAVHALPSIRFSLLFTPHSH